MQGPRGYESSDVLGFASAHRVMGRPATPETTPASVADMPHRAASSAGPWMGSQRPSKRASQNVTVIPQITSTHRIERDTGSITPLESLPGLGRYCDGGGSLVSNTAARRAVADCWALRPAAGRGRRWDLGRGHYAGGGKGLAELQAHQAQAAAGHRGTRRPAATARRPLTVALRRRAANTYTSTGRLPTQLPANPGSEMTHT